MEAFYVSIIFLGIILVVAALFFIIMDKVNGKDFFKEFDRKKDEMFNLIQDSEDMVQELNKMSDYVVTVIAEKNQEFFNKTTKHKEQEPLIELENVKEDIKELPAQEQQEQRLLNTQENSNQKMLSEDTVVKSEDLIHNKNDVKQMEAAELQKGAVFYNAKDVAHKYKNLDPQNKGLITQNEIHKLSDLIEDNSMNSVVIEDGYSTSDNMVKAQKAPDFPIDFGKEIENSEPENLRTPKLTLSGRRGVVLQMIEHGLTDEEISEKLRIGKGEVRLIRGLSK